MSTQTGTNEMTETKKPQAKEWWRTDNGEILFFVGCTSGGDQSWEDRHGCFIGLVDIDRGWQHLPECDGFDWVEQKWPKYYVDTRNKMDGFFRRDSESSYTVVRSNGEEILQCGHAGILEQVGVFIEITKPGALARLDNLVYRECHECGWVSQQADVDITWICSECGHSHSDRPIPRCPDCGEPAGEGHADVCPEAWVVQDRVPYRTGDQIRWSILDESEPWLAVYGPPGRKLSHGYTDYTATLQVRCRRKDLPVSAATDQRKRREMTDAERQCADVPQGFVEITDGEWRYRESVDWVWYDYRKVWQPVNRLHGMSKNIWLPGYPRACCHVSDAPQAAVTHSDGELGQFLPSTQQAFDDLHRRCSDLSGQVDRLKREVQTVVDGVGAAQDRYDRSLPVTGDWLKSMGFTDFITHRPAVKIRIDHFSALTCWTDENKWTVSDNFSHEVVLAECVENRGRVIDLLKGLGIEIKVATSNVSATSDSGKWAMDQA